MTKDEILKAGQEKIFQLGDMLCQKEKLEIRIKQVTSETLELESKLIELNKAETEQKDPKSA